MNQARRRVMRELKDEKIQSENLEKQKKINDLIAELESLKNEYEQAIKDVNLQRDNYYKLIIELQEEKNMLKGKADEFLSRHEYR